MDFAFYVILALVASLTQPHTQRCTLSIKDDTGKARRYTLTLQEEDIWNLESLNDSYKEVKQLNFKLGHNHTLKSLILNEDVHLPNYFKVEGISWKDCKDIAPNALLEKRGMKALKIKRSEQGFSIEQKRGFIADWTIEVSW